jgi:LPS export ABC transporter protein LptC
MVFSCVLYAFLSIACSFDYGAEGSERSRPDIVMENIEYTRVRGGDILARFHGEHAERWEDNQIMLITNFTFEQMEDKGATVNVEGSAGAAEVQLESGDITLFAGVIIKIESEDVIIHINRVDWKDKEKTLTGGAGERVDIQRSDGTNFTGMGVFADIRSRTWSFSGEVEGTYVEEDDEEDEEDDEEEDNEIE